MSEEAQSRNPSVSCWDSITSSTTPCCGTLEPSHKVWATVPPTPKGKPEEGPRWGSRMWMQSAPHQPGTQTAPRACFLGPKMG